MKSTIKEAVGGMSRRSSAEAATKELLPPKAVSWLLPSMEMSGRCNNKKRKICYQEDEEEDDEQKMEKFFAIIRSIREARENIMGVGHANGPAAEQGRSNAAKKSKPDDAVEAVWKPSFEREDFMGEADRTVMMMMMMKNNPPAAASTEPSGTKKGADDRKDGVGEEELNLKLSL